MARDDSKLAFNSLDRYEYVSLKSNSPFSVAAFGTKTIAIPHGLGYKPYYKAWYTYGSGKYFRLFSGTASYALDGNGGQVDSVNVDATNFNVTFSENNGSPINGTLYYRIYAEPQT